MKVSKLTVVGCKIQSIAKNNKLYLSDEKNLIKKNEVNTARAKQSTINKGKVFLLRISFSLNILRCDSFSLLSSK